MSRFSVASALALFVLALSTGCGSAAGARLIGKWQVDSTQAAKAVDSAVAAQKDNPLAGAMAGMAKGMMESMKIEMEFKSQGQLVFSAAIMGQSINKSGTWRVVRSSGNDVTIAVKMDGETAERESTITFVDNDTIETIPPTDTGPKLKSTFRRAKK